MAGTPQSHLTLREGTPVLSADGDRVGVVAHVLTDEPTGIFEGLVVDTGGLAGGHHFADAEEVAGIGEDAVVLTLGREAAGRLPGVSERSTGDRLRRAWDWVSGRY